MDDLARDPRSLALYLKRTTHNGHTPHVLLVIDQFEELFTLCRDEFEREAFIDNLLTTLTASPLSLAKRSERREESGREDGGEGLVTLIITIRADFYAHLAQYPELREAVASSRNTSAQ
jgi:hypothetical protein